MVPNQCGIQEIADMKHSNLILPFLNPSKSAVNFSAIINKNTKEIRSNITYAVLAVDILLNLFHISDSSSISHARFAKHSHVRSFYDPIQSDHFYSPKCC